MLIFLDIDGVMVPAAGWKIPENLEDGFPMFTQKSIDSLNSLLSPQTQIILSTSHRDRFTLKKWMEIFKKRGLKVRKLGRLPSSSLPSKRKDEILHWFSTHPRPTNFLIIDDDKSLHDLPKELKDHLIVTSPLIGLTRETINEVRGSSLVNSY